MPNELLEFTWASTILGNQKINVAGACHALKYRKYADPYLAPVDYRFNRRFDLLNIVPRLVADVDSLKQASETVSRTYAEPRFNQVLA